MTGKYPGFFAPEAVFPVAGFGFLWAGVHVSLGFQAVLFSECLGVFFVLADETHFFEFIVHFDAPIGRNPKELYGYRFSGLFLMSFNSVVPWGLADDMVIGKLFT